MKKESQLIGNILAEDVYDDHQQHHQPPQNIKNNLDAKAKVAASISRSSSAPPQILPEDVCYCLIRISFCSLLEIP